MIPSNLALRPETAEDETFLRRLYAATRAEEMARVPWPEPQKVAFLDLQFDLQRRHYRTHHPAADFLIVLLAERPVGRLYLDRGGPAFILIDIALLPDCRSRGMGGHLLETLLAEAGAAAKPVRLHVAAGNRAVNLYRRLGFVPVETEGIYWRMEWTPRRRGDRNGAN